MGLDELEYVHAKLKDFIPGKEEVELDVTLARGLNYYTGIIIEVKAHEVEMGSICGGGRYDDLTALFGLNGISGVGISFGADRIYDVLTSLDLFPNYLSTGPEILFLNFSDAFADACDTWAQVLREMGKKVEVYPTNAKLQKQMKYANDRGAQWTAFYGEEEAANQRIVLKNMTAGEQTTYETSTWIADWIG
jgi:histidyl-tRNA synthetase